MRSLERPLAKLLPQGRNEDNRLVSAKHYENFPVASWLCPPAQRPAVMAIYRFARTADDMADEGDASAAERIAQLALYRLDLHAAYASRATSGQWPRVFADIAQCRETHQLPLAQLAELLDAFMQDASNPIYADRDALLHYCARSANPVGRLILHLNGIDDALSKRQSDAICTALQLINFWQDLSVDLPRQRHYVADEDLANHQLLRTDLRPGGDNKRTRSLVQSLCEWARTLMLDGAPLPLRMKGRAAWELRLVVQGGLRILEKMQRMNYATLSHRPTLSWRDAPALLARASTMRNHGNKVSA